MAMLRDGLRTELPEIFVLAARLRPIAVVEMPLWLVAIAALGMRGLAGQLLLGAVFSLVTVTGLQIYASSAITVVANALAVLVAFGSARWRGVAAAAGLFGVLWLEQFVLSMPGLRRLCEQTDPKAPPPTCDVTAQAFNSLWPIAAGVAAALLLRRVVRQGTPGKAGVLIAVGVSALAFPVARLLVDPDVGVFWHGSYSRDAINAILMAQLVGALALGTVAGYVGRRHLLDGVVIAGYYLLPWLPEFELWRRNVPRPFNLQVDWQGFVQLGYALAALGALTVAALVRHRRRPIADA